MPERPAPTISTSRCSLARIVCIWPILKTWMPGTRPGMTKLPAAMWRPSIPIMLRLERAFRLHADIVGLVGAKLGEVHADLGEVQARDLFIERLRQHVDLLFVFAVLVVGEEFDLRQRLVGERGRHHEAR